MEEKSKLLLIIYNLPWTQIALDLWEASKNQIRRLRSQGMYEALEYETTLELYDRKGKQATVTKREKVRYLQDNIIAYEDQAWGDGEFLLDYKCTPGYPVDQYRLGYKTYILISLREVKHKNDVDEFNTEWGIKDGFLRKDEQWETEIRHRINNLTVKIIFPKSRPPLKAAVTEQTRQITRDLDQDAIRKLPDGRWLVEWEAKHPRLHEHYILKWEW